jgi:hypothetical protein
MMAVIALARMSTDTSRTACREPYQALRLRMLMAASGAAEFDTIGCLLAPGLLSCGASCMPGDLSMVTSGSSDRVVIEDSQSAVSVR